MLSKFSRSDIIFDIKYHLTYICQETLIKKVRQKWAQGFTPRLNFETESHLKNLLIKISKYTHVAKMEYTVTPCNNEFFASPE